MITRAASWGCKGVHFVQGYAPSPLTAPSAAFKTEERRARAARKKKRKEVKKLIERR